MPLVSFILRRFLTCLVTMLIVATLVFFITAVLPGDVATRILGRAPDPVQLELLRDRLGVNEPLLTRYLTWLGDLLMGNPGNSLISGQPVAPVIARAFWNSTLLALFVLALYLPMTVIPATIQALRVDRPVDTLFSGISLVIQSMPDFLIGTVLLLLLANFLPILPPRSTIDGSSSTIEVLRALVLPGVTVALVMATYAMRFLRDSLIDVLNSDYVRMARLNGITERRILWCHALPNALVPAMTVTSLSLTYLFGGVVVVEQVFAFPGIGQLLVGALMQLDVPVIQATVLVASGVYLLGNLLVEILTLYFNPRLRQL